ncbi:MAG: hypothetical protein RLZZ524_937 [Pseudomonadota bacterium]
MHQIACIIVQITTKAPNRKRTILRKSQSLTPAQVQRFRARMRQHGMDEP